MLFLATLGSSVGTLLAAVALDDRRQGPDELRPAGSARVLIVEFLPTIVVGLLLGPLLDRLAAARADDRRRLVRVGVFVALPFAPSAGGDRRARVRRRPRDRLLPAGRLRGRAEPRRRARCCRRRTRSSRPSRTSAGRSARSSAGSSPRPRARTPPTAINAVSFLVSAVLVVADPGAAAAERARADARPLARPRGRLPRDAALAPAARGARRLGHRDRSAAARSTSSEIFLAKNTLDAGDFGYGLLYGAHRRSGSCSAACWSARCSSASAIARATARALARDGARLRRGAA